MALRVAVAGEPVEIELARPAALDGFFVLSPCVRADGDGYEMFVRVVNPAPDPQDKVARIHRARGRDGRAFALEPEPAIAPGTPDDDGGCEDPTVSVNDGTYTVYYSGYSRETQASALLAAAGSSASALRASGRVLPDDPRFRNAKEASVVAAPDGASLYFEYARDGASLIGRARHDGTRWAYAEANVAPVPGQWDGHHLSPGPAVPLADGRSLLFYNGATQDAHWRIGWLVLAADGATVEQRCAEPLIVPPAAQGDAADIAFAASAVPLADAIWVYYSIADKRLMRATVRVSQA